MDEICVHFKFGDCFAVDARGHSGGLAALWKDTPQVTITSFSDNFINFLVFDGVLWNLEDDTFTYFQKGREIELLGTCCTLLVVINPEGKWCCIGAFNDILSREEKRGLHARPQGFIDGFREAVSYCGLFDINLEGYPFTWSHSKGRPSVVALHLDRAMANEEWQLCYPHTRLVSLIVPTSDHTPVLLSTTSVDPNGCLDVSTLKINGLKNRT
ncbi:hypothetical protein LINPERPRIM_LOCUS512 [Linum perenne]